MRGVRAVLSVACCLLLTARPLQITTAVLEKVCQYFYHDLRCKQIRAARGPETPLPEFPIAPEIVLELLQVRRHMRALCTPGGSLTSGRPDRQATTSIASRAWTSMPSTSTDVHV